jgi:toxin ParE1/3/4
MKVIWTREALDKLTEIEEFIAQDSPQRAETFVSYLIERGESISKNPQIGRIVPEILNSDIREIIVRKYRIVYRVQKELIEILTVFEGHRLLRLGEVGVGVE